MAETEGPPSRACATLPRSACSRRRAAPASAAGRSSARPWTCRGRAAPRRASRARRSSRASSRPRWPGTSAAGSRAARSSTALKPPVDLRRQPLEPHGHADDPARAAAPVAPAHGGRRGGRLLLPQALGRGRRVAAVQHGADLAPRRRAWTTAPPTTCTASCDQRWNLLLYPEGTRSRDGSRGKLHSGAAVLAAAHDVPILPIYVVGHARGDAARPLAGRAACAPAAPSAASRSACASARRSARSRASTATRRWPASRRWFDAQEGIVPTGAPLAPSAVASAEDRPMTPSARVAAPASHGTSAPPANR